MRCLNTQMSSILALSRPPLFTRTNAFKECSLVDLSYSNILLPSNQQEQGSCLLTSSKNMEFLSKKDRSEPLYVSETTQISLEECSIPEFIPDEDQQMKPLKRRLWEIEQYPNASKLIELQSHKKKKSSDDEKSTSEKNFSDKADYSSDSADSKKGRITMSQNYKSTIARGFVRVMKNSLKSPQSHYYQQIIYEVSQIKEELGFKAISNDKLALSTIEYVVDTIKEKSQRKKNNKTKARNVKVIDSIFFPKTGDEDAVLLYKKVSFKILKYFLKDSNFHTWVLEDCKSSEDNKKFLLENLTEIRKVFENPLTYKAGFHK